MATTLNNIQIKKNNWVDIYSLASITVGSSLIITNIGSNVINAVEKDTIPEYGDGYIKIITGGTFGSWVNITSGSKKIWLKSLGGDSIVNVQEV
jgi:hypothetical protein